MQTVGQYASTAGKQTSECKSGEGKLQLGDQRRKFLCSVLFFFGLILAAHITDITRQFGWTACSREKNGSKHKPKDRTDSSDEKRQNPPK